MKDLDYKICPFYQEPTASCREDRCEWWDAYLKHCLIWRIAFGIAGQARQPSLDVEGEDE